MNELGRFGAVFHFHETSGSGFDTRRMSVRLGRGGQPDEPRRYQGLRQLAGDVVLVLDGVSLSAEQIRDLAALDNLVALKLNNVKGTEFSWISRLGALEELSVSGSPTPDALASHASQLLNLRVFEASGLSAAGVKSVGNMRNLEHLLIDDAVLPENATRDWRFPRLASLSLTASRVTEDTFAFLRNCPRVRRLTLSRSDVSDNCLEHVSRVDALEELRIDGTFVTAGGLLYLCTLKNLASLDWTPPRRQPHEDPPASARVSELAIRLWSALADVSDDQLLELIDDYHQRQRDYGAEWFRDDDADHGASPWDAAEPPSADSTRAELNQWMLDELEPVRVFRRMLPHVRLTRRR